MIRKFLSAGALLALSGQPADAYDLTEWLSVGGLVAGAAQCFSLTEDAGNRDDCGNAVHGRPEVSLRPFTGAEFHAKAGFAAGNGVNRISPFALEPWEEDLQDDLEDINGRNRDHLLTLWYKQSFALGPESSLVATGGIIDATDYLDENAYANDETTQFMNEAFENVTFFLPSYDYGGVAELNAGRWALRGVIMNVGENDGRKNYNFYGGEVGYQATTPLGEGNYRLLVAATDAQFLDPQGLQEESLGSISVSADQEIGDYLGVWFRIGWQRDAAAVTFDAILSGGFDVKGGAWGREHDNIGVAYAYLPGGNLDLASSQVIEAYYRMIVLERLGLTADIQYMRDERRADAGPDVAGFVFGTRADIEF